MDPKRYKLRVFILCVSIISGCILFFSKSGIVAYFFPDSRATSCLYFDDTDTWNDGSLGIHTKAMLSSRFKNLTHLKTMVSIQYDQDYSKLDSNAYRQSMVHLKYPNNAVAVQRTMISGISQNKILELRNADYFTRSCFAFSNSYIIRQRKELEVSYILARRKPVMFGPGDKSFYDLALESFQHINTPELAFQNVRDSSEKGYINTFNHVTAQAIITSFFSEDLGDLIGDLHERQNMPEITSGRFTQKQLNDSINSPEDNYVDIINNEIGQKIGLKLRHKYKLNETTKCNEVLLASYLNDIQSYYMWALEIGMDPYRPTDDIIIKFSNKINALLKSL